MRRSHKSKSTALSLVLLILISSLPIFPVSLVKASPDTLTLRPNGDDTVQWGIYPTTPTTHYDKVNETSPDNDGTYIYTNVEPESDLFTLTDTSQTGTINSVTVWARIKTLGNERTKIGVKTYGISYWSASIIVTTSYADYSAAWTTNPQAFNLTIDVKRTVVFIKLAEGPINFVTIITSFKMKVFTIDQKLNVLIQTIRTITLLRVTQQPFSVEAIATILKILTRKHDQAFSMITEVTTFIGAYALIEEALLFVTQTIRFSILTRQIDGVLNMIIESLRRLSLFRTFNQPLSLIIEAIGIKLVSTRVVSQVLNVLSDVTRKLTFQRPINQFFSLFIQATRVLIRKRIIDQILTLLIDVQGVTPIEERIVYQVLSFFAQAVRQISFQRIVDLILAVKTSVISVLFPYAPPTPPAPVPRPPIGPPFDLMITEPAHVAYRWWDPTFQLAFLVVNKGTLATEAELTWVILREGIKVTSGRTTFYVTGLEKKEIAFDVSTPSIEGDYKIEAEITYPVKAEATSMFDVTIAIPTLTQTLIFIIALLILYVIQKKIRGGSAR